MSSSSIQQTGEPALQILLLGQFEVLRDGEPISNREWGRQKTVILLKILLTDPDRVFTQDQLIDLLFEGENVGQARKNLYGRVSQLRRALEPNLERGIDSAFIQRRSQGYVFHVGRGVWIDTLQFQEHLRAARERAEQKDWGSAAEQFEDARSLYQGDLLPEERYEDWAEEARGELRRRHLEGLMELATCYEQMGRIRQAISCCQGVLGLEPHREDVLRRLMNYECEAGQLEEAIQTFRHCEAILREKFDVEPSAETRALHERILRRVQEEPALDPRRIAVLPLQNFGSEPDDDSLADGMTEELISWIAKVQDFRVVARTSVMRFKNTSMPISQIARDLNVGTVLEGSIRRARDRIRVSAQLIDAATEDHLWAENYDLSTGDILAVQSWIARQVCDELKLELLSGEEKALRQLEQMDSENHVLYLKGLYFLGRSGLEALRSAIGCFESVVKRNPRHTRALASLARAHCQLVAYSKAGVEFPKAREYAERALSVDPADAEAVTVLAVVAEGHDGAIHEAERLLCRAISLDPSCAWAHSAYADLLVTMDRTAEAIDAGRRALSLDPLSPRLIVVYASCLYSQGRYGEAAEQGKNAVELDPDLLGAWWIWWYSIAATWDWNRAETAIRGMVDRHPENPVGRIYLAACVMCRGRIDEGIDEVEKALALPRPEDHITIPLFAGCHYFFARKYDQALTYLGEVLERNPRAHTARIVRSNCYLMQERFDECLAELEIADRTWEGSNNFWYSYVRSNRGSVYAFRGETEKAERELNALMQGTGNQNRRIAASMVLGALGRVEEAIDWAEAAADAREPHVVCLRKAPQTSAEVWNHPRYQALLERIGLGDPEVSRSEAGHDKG